MNDYIFFEAGLRDRFVKQAQALGVACELRDDTMGLVVAVQEELADDVLDTLEARYDELQDAQSELMAQSEGGFKKLAGFKLVLPDGQSCMVPLQPDMANRLLSCFSLEEIQTLFDAVARSALSPQDKHWCEILRADANTAAR